MHSIITDSLNIDSIYLDYPITLISINWFIINVDSIHHLSSYSIHHLSSYSIYHLSSYSIHHLSSYSTLTTTEHVNSTITWIHHNWYLYWPPIHSTTIGYSYNLINNLPSDSSLYSDGMSTSTSISTTSYILLFQSVLIIILIHLYPILISISLHYHQTIQI